MKRRDFLAAGVAVVLLPRLAHGLGHAVTFAPGIHNITETILIDTDNTYIELMPGSILKAVGIDTIIQIGNGTPLSNVGVYGKGKLEGGKNGIRAVGTLTNVSLTGFEVEGAQTIAVRIDGHFGQGCKLLSINSLYVHDCAEGIVFRHCQDFSVTNNIVFNMTGQDCIEPANCQRGIISHNRIKNPGTGNSGIDVFVNTTTNNNEIAEVSGVVISNNVIYRDEVNGYRPRGITLDGNVTNVTIEANDISGTYSMAIYLMKNCNSITVSNNPIHNVGGGIMVNKAKENIQIEGNPFKDVTGWNVLLGPSAGGIALRNNIFVGGSPTRAQVHITGSPTDGVSSHLIDGNVFSNEGSQEIAGWGIANAGNPRLSVTNNDFTRITNVITSPYASNLVMRDNLF